MAAAQAKTGLTSSPFGIALGQTARLSYFNTSPTQTILVSGSFVDSDGSLLETFRAEIAPGQTIFFDLNRDSLSRDSNRLQIHVEVDSAPSRQLLPALEVFNNADGTTAVSVISGEVFVKLPAGGNVPEI